MADMRLGSISVAFAMALATACGDVSTTRASSTGEARQQLEPGGWWPSEILDAATSILETHDLDTNVQKVIFAIEREPCRQQLARMAISTTTRLAPAPELPLEGWPEWLPGGVAADADSMRRRGATVVRTEQGTLLLVCDAAKGYFWR